MKLTLKTILTLILISALYFWWIELNRPEFVVIKDKPRYMIKHPCFECHYDDILSIIHDLKQVKNK